MPLTAGWSGVWDASRQMYYYYHAGTGTTTWEQPADARPVGAAGKQDAVAVAAAAFTLEDAVFRSAPAAANNRTTCRATASDATI